MKRYSKYSIIAIAILLCSGIALADTLEERVDALEQRVAYLESWQGAVNSIFSNLFSWLFYHDYDDIKDALRSNCEGCNGDDGPLIPENGDGEHEDILCYADTDCGNSYVSELLYCMSGDVYSESVTYSCMNPGTASSECHATSVPTLIEECDYGCSEGVCNVQDEYSLSVIFRTNVVDGDFFSCGLQSGCWIAFDESGDGNLDALGFDGKARSCRSGDELGLTHNNLRIIDYGVSGKVEICDINGYGIRFSLSRASGAETSEFPTEPFAGLGLERYGMPIPAGGGNQGGEYTGPLVNVGGPGAVVANPV